MTNIERGKVELRIDQMNATLAMHMQAASGESGDVKFRILTNVAGIDPIITVKAPGDKEETWYEIELRPAIDRVLEIHEALSKENRGMFPADGKALRDARDEKAEA